jgi:fatty acid-binding protein DegV
MGVQPIIVVTKEGKAELFGKPTSTKQSMKMVMDETIKLIEGKKLWGYASAHAQNQEGADWYANEMESITGLKPKFISAASPVLGTHVGPGVVGLAFLLE